MKILLVDDSMTSRLLLESFLRGAGYTDITSVESAQQALEILQADEVEAEVPDVDLILMDFLMPGMDGIEATALIKSKPHLKDIPIVMVTVNDETHSLERAFDVGATDYINKPVDKVELRARVGSVLKFKEEMDRRKQRERELEELTIKLETLSMLDGLTSIRNRRSFDATLEKEWHRAKRNGSRVALLMLDIDFFKAYNDTYGHLKGDDCLRKIAATVSGALQRSADFVARYGGEEFVVLLPETDQQGALVIAETVRQSVESLQWPHASSSVADFLTVSIGLAVSLPSEGGTPRGLIAAADSALYEAKTGGRNCVRISSDGGIEIPEDSDMFRPVGSGSRT